jgi:nicotinamide phosphoribosyltransferase
LSFPTGILSIVIDSYKWEDVVQMLTKEFLPIVKARNGKIVLRPDSGIPNQVINRILTIVETNLSSDISFNELGYKVLPSYIGIIYGDGLTPDVISDILENVTNLGWSAENLVFGMGGGLLQKVNRDTCKFAWKCCAIQTADGVWHDVFKDPIDGKGTSQSKASLRGRQKVVKIDGVYKTVREDDPTYSDLPDELELVYLNGHIMKTYTFEEVRANAELNLD